MHIHRVTKVDEKYYLATMDKTIVVDQPGYIKIMFYKPEVPDGSQLILDNLLLTRISGDIE